MDQIFIICVDDQSEVLNALENDLSLFDEEFNVEVCDSADEALELIDEVDQNGDHVALIISDQVMPKVSGVEFLSKVTQDGRFETTQKMLLTGQATHQDTIEAINLGGIAQYLEKPWQKDNLIEMTKRLLTRYIMEKGIDHQQYQHLLDQEVILASMRKSTS